MSVKVSYSAPGKIIISGEHAVVYGKPAIVSTIDLRLMCTVTEGYQRIDPNINFVADLVKKYLDDKKIPLQHKHYRVRIRSSIPRKRGMGASAAFSVASVASFLEFFSGSTTHTTEEINNLAYQVEKHFHHNPSGVDQTASCFGGLIFFRKEFEFLKGIYKLSFKIPEIIEKDLYLIDSGKAVESTGIVVTHVGELYNKYGKKIQDILIETEKVTKRITVAIVKEDKKLFDENITLNGQLLIDLGVVSKSTQKLLRELIPFGVGKITGGGGIKKGSGYILFSATDSTGLIDYCKKNNISIIKFKQSYIGLQRL